MFFKQYHPSVENEEFRDILCSQRLAKDDETHKVLIIETIDKFKSTIINTNNKNILLEFFSFYNSKKNIKKFLLDKLKAEKNLLETLIVCTANEILENFKKDIIYIKLSIQFFNIVGLHMQSFKIDKQYEFLIGTVFPIYIITYRALVDLFRENENFCLPKNEDISSIMDEILKQLLEILAKCKNIKNLKNYSLELVNLSFEVIKYDKIKYEMRAKAGLLLAHSLFYLPDEDTELISHKEYPILDILDNLNQQFCLTLKSKKLENIFVEDTYNIILIYATFNATDNFDIMFKNQPLLMLLIRDLLDIAKRIHFKPPQMIVVARTLSMLSQRLSKLSTQCFKALLPDCLNFVWTNLEHYVESVKHYVKAFFIKIAQHCLFHHKNGMNEFFNFLIKEIKCMSPLNNVRLITLGILCENIDHKLILTNFENIKNYLLSILDTANEAYKIYVFLMEKEVNQLGTEEFTAEWVYPVLQNLKTQKLETNASENIVVRAFQLNPFIFSHLYRQNYIGIIIQLRCIHYARLKNINLLNDSSDVHWRNLFPKKKLQICMVDQNENVRLSVLHAIIECQKSTEELTEWELAFLLAFYIYNASNQNTSIRNKIGSLYKKLFDRYHASFAVLNRQRNLAGKPEINKTLKSYYYFLDKFISLLKNNLVPNANYPRKALALELLLYASKIASKEQWENSFNEIDINNLKQLLYDNYDSNKAMAVSLLRTLPPTLIGFKDKDTTQQYFNECIKCALRTSRIKCLASAYMLEVCLCSPFPLNEHQEDNRWTMLVNLLSLLKDMFEKNQKDIIKAANERPMHEIVHCIKSLLSTYKGNDEKYKAVFKNTVDLSFSIKTHIMPIVSNPSPEGHIPENDYVVDETLTAQRVLMYSWRTMKEIMHLLAEIVKQTIERELEMQMLSEDDLIKVGECFIDIFLQTKHRGVFEQAFVAFSIVCQQFWRSSCDQINSLPQKWLDMVINICNGTTVDERLCATRRSAGLPFLILSIITTETPLGKSCFHKIMTELLAVANAEEEKHELKMHSLNILRFIVQNSKLGDFVVSYLSKAFITVFKGFQSTIWGVRNSSTLLFAALITRMFGVQRTSHSLLLKNRMTITNFSLKYKDLLEFLLENFELECKRKESHALYPMLILLNRLYPSHSYTKTDVVSLNFDICLSSPVFSIRELAAQASVCLMPLHVIPEQLSKNFYIISNKNLKDNNCQGLLLQIKLLLENCRDFDIPATYYLNILFNLLKNKLSPMTMNFCLEIIVKLLHFDISLDVLTDLSNLVVNLNSSGQSRWTKIEVLLLILNRIYSKKEIQCKNYPIYELIEEILYSGDFYTKDFCLKFFLQLNEIKSNKNKNHPLFISEDIEIPENIIELVNTLRVEVREYLITYFNSLVNDFLINQLKEDKINVLNFLLLKYYPLAIQKTGKIFQEQLDLLLRFCTCNDEEIICSVIDFLSLFIKMNKNEIQRADFKKLIKILIKSASPTCSDFRRLSVAQFLVSVPLIFYDNVENQLHLFSIIMALFEDDEAIVRDTMSEIKLNGSKTTPEKARADFLKFCLKVLPEDLGILFLFEWSLRHIPLEQDGPDLYEAPKLNQYAENVPIIYFASVTLRDVLGSTKVTKSLINSLSTNEVPMIEPSTRKAAIDALKKINLFFEVNPDGNFKDLFYGEIKEICSSCPDYCLLFCFFTELFKHNLEKEVK